MNLIKRLTSCLSSRAKVQGNMQMNLLGFKQNYHTFTKKGGRRFPELQLTACMRVGFSTQKAQGQSRKLVEIIESILPSILQKQDYSEIAEFIHQIAIVLVTDLFPSNKQESKRILRLIFSVLQHIEGKATSAEAEKILSTLKVLSTHIDQINETNLIIQVDETYLHYIQKFQGKGNALYIEVLSKLAQNCIAGEEFQKGLNYLQESESLILQLSIDIGQQLKLQNMINIAIAYLSMGRTEESIQANLKALQLAQSSQNGQLSSYRIAIYQCLGDIFKSNSDFQQSIRYYSQSLSLSRQYFEKTNINHVIILFKISQSLQSLKKYAQVISNCKLIEEELRSNIELKDEFQFYNEMLLMLGDSHSQLGNYELSIKYYQDYVTIVERSIIIDEKNYIQALNKLVQVYLKAKHPKNAVTRLKTICKYYKIQGNSSKQQKSQQRLKEIQTSLQL